MTAESVLQHLVKEGALIADALNSGMQTLPVHAELVTPAPKRELPAVGWLYWVEVGAEDQHNTHFWVYAKAKIIHYRDLSLTDANGKAVAYIAPFEEWYGMDAHELRLELAQAHWNIARTSETRETFDRFVANCRPEPDRADQTP